MVKFLIIDNAADMLEVLGVCLKLQFPDCSVVSAGEEAAALELARTGEPDLIILDADSPGLDGFDICSQIRAMSRVPIIMLSSMDRDLDVVGGLAAGADDYVTKPFSHVEFLARVRALLRRSGWAIHRAQEAPTSGNLVLSSVARRAWVKGKEVHLTPTEFRLLSLLAHNANRVLPNQELLAKVWGKDYTSKVGYVKTHVQHLRRKLGDSASSPRLILTERGGYRLSVILREEKAK